MQRPSPTLEEHDKDIIKSEHYFQAKQQALALILSQFSTFIEEASYKSKPPVNFYKKFESRKKMLVEKNKEFINIIDQLYVDMQIRFPTIDKPSLKFLTSLNNQLSNKQISWGVSGEQQYNDYADIYILLKMLLNKLTELYQTCIKHICQSLYQIPNPPAINDYIAEEDDIDDQSITHLLRDETWLNVISFLNREAVENLGKTSKRFLNLTRDKQCYRLFPVATDFTEPKNIVSCDITGSVLSTLSPNRKWVAISKKNPSCLCIYATTGHLLQTISLPTTCHYLNFSPDSENLVIGYSQYGIKTKKMFDVINTKNWQTINTFSSNYIAFGKQICMNNTNLFILHLSPTNTDKNNHKLISYHLLTGKENIIDNSVDLKNTYVDKLVASTDQTQILGIAAGARQTAIHIMSTSNVFSLKTRFLTYWLQARYTTMQMIPDSKKLLFITATNPGVLSEYDPSTDTYCDLVKFSPCRVLHFHISHDARYFVAIMRHDEEGHKVELYHLKKRELLGYFICPNKGAVNDIYIDHNNTRIIIVLEKELLIYTFDSIKPDFDKLRKDDEEKLVNGIEEEKSTHNASCLTM